MPAVLWKPIKPARFRSEVFRQEMEREARAVADAMLLDFLLTVSKWKRQPKFAKEVSVGPNSVDILVGTDDEIYGYVSRGTRPHIIRPVRAKALRFQAGYKAKTTPGLISSHSGGAFGEEMFRPEVRHPGTEPRNFEKAIEKKWKPEFRKRMQAAMAQASRASGHGIK
jgi:hypothetical protein